jgi:general secretion pathway protein B
MAPAPGGQPPVTAPAPGTPPVAAPGPFGPPVRNAVPAPAPPPPPPPPVAGPRPPLPPPPPAQPVKGLPPDAPTLVISGGVYSAKADQRMAIVNGKVVREGAELGSGVVLQQITPAGVVLAFRGEQYRVRY